MNFKPYIIYLALTPGAVANRGMGLQLGFECSVDRLAGAFHVFVLYILKLTY